MKELNILEHIGYPPSIINPQIFNALIDKNINIPIIKSIYISPDSKIDRKSIPKTYKITQSPSKADICIVDKLKYSKERVYYIPSSDEYYSTNGFQSQDYIIIGTYDICSDNKIHTNKFYELINSNLISSESFRKKYLSEDKLTNFKDIEILFQDKLNNFSLAISILSKYDISDFHVEIIDLLLYTNKSSFGHLKSYSILLNKLGLDKSDLRNYYDVELYNKTYKHCSDISKNKIKKYFKKEINVRNKNLKDHIKSSYYCIPNLIKEYTIEKNNIDTGL